MKSIPVVYPISLIASYRVLLTPIVFLLSACAVTMPTQKPIEFPFIETTIDDIHTAIKDRSIDCEGIISGFLNRIKKYDEISSLNSIIYINQNAIKKAQALDKKYQKTKPGGDRKSCDFKTTKCRFDSFSEGAGECNEPRFADY